ncbi:MAG: adenylate kinase [Osedax symbiont Rs2]|nr:MAG: adenylate kinase [Osedax symbiont Rs2]
MKKINVTGTTGSGKSTFSKRLAKQLDYPCIHMDQLFWKADWVETTDEEFIAKVALAISTDDWVLDGNYSRTNTLKWADVDTIIWLDYSYLRTFWQLFKRTMLRAYAKQEIWPETGNKETFAKAFLSRKSIFVWFFRCYNRNKIKYEKLITCTEFKHVEYIRLRNPCELEQFLKNIKTSIL